AQAHVQLLFDYKAMTALKTQAVKGQFEPTEALRLLLRGTGFTFHQVNDHTIAVVAVGSDSVSSASAFKQPSSYGGFLVALTTQEQTTSPGSMGQQPVQTAESSGQLQEVVVTAQRREERLQSVPISVTVFDQTTMDAQGTRSIDDLARLTPAITFTH